MNELAGGEIGIDPAELRLKNIIREGGDEHPALTEKS